MYPSDVTCLMSKSIVGLRRNGFTLVNTTDFYNESCTRFRSATWVLCGRLVREGLVCCYEKMYGMTYITSGKRFRSK